MQHHYQRRMSLPTPNLCALLLTGPTTIMCLDHCIQTPRQLRLPLVRVPPPTLDFPSIKVEENIYTMKIRFCCTIYNEIILLLYIFFFTLIDKYTMKSCFVVFFFFFAPHHIMETQFYCIVIQPKSAPWNLVMTVGPIANPMYK